MEVKKFLCFLIFLFWIQHGSSVIVFLAEIISMTRFYVSLSDEAQSVFDPNLLNNNNNNDDQVGSFFDKFGR